MKKWQSFSALKRVKSEIEALSADLGKALESVIATPVGDHKDLGKLKASVKAFARVPGTLRLLEFTQLSLLAQELILLLVDTLKAEATMDPRELDPRLETAFVAITDLPALLEHALRQEQDNFVHVSTLVNRLRKGRACAIVFANNALLEKEEISFRSRFAKQGDKMLELLGKQADYFLRAVDALQKNAEDTKALQILATVLGNLEVMLRDHRIGVLWGLGHGLLELYQSKDSDKSALVACFQRMVPAARQLIAGSTTALQGNMDETTLEAIVDVFARTPVNTGRPAIIKLWYNLDMNATREHKLEYRNLQVQYYNKEALTHSLQLIVDSIRSLIDSINTLAEESSLYRTRVKEIFADIASLKNVLHILRMQFLVDFVDEALPSDPGVDLEKALSQAAGVLFRINNELCNKLDSMEREVFSTDRGLTSMQPMNSGRLQILQTAMQSLEAVMADLDDFVEWAAMANPSAEEPGMLEHARNTLDSLACVLATLPLHGQAASLATARDYIGAMMQHKFRPTADEHFLVLSHLLINSIRNLEQLTMGREDASASRQNPVVMHAAALRSHLDFIRVDDLQLARQKRMDLTQDSKKISSVPAVIIETVNLTTIAAHNEDRPDPVEPLAEPVLIHTAEVSDESPEMTSVAKETVQGETKANESVDEELLAIFLEEAGELLQSLNNLFLHWQQQPDDKACKNEYLRALHTIKGSAALVCEHDLSKCAHDYESFILAAQQDSNTFDAAFFANCDSHLHTLNEIYTLYQRDADGHISRGTASMAIEPQISVEPAENHVPEAQVADQQPEQPIIAAEIAAPLACTEEKIPGDSSVTEAFMVAPVVETMSAFSAQPATTNELPSLKVLGSAFTHQEAEPAAPDEQVRVSSKLLRSLLNDADEINFSRSRMENCFHDIGLLLMDMDETLNRFLSYVKNIEHKAGTAPARLEIDNSEAHDAEEQFDALEMDRYTEFQELSLSLTEDYNDLQDIRVNLAGRVRDIDNMLSGQQRVTNSLQDGLISSQMVPFASIVPRLGTLVRQISAKLKKQVRFDVDNRQGSLDKNILQAIITPLEHIIRNAIDHGIEAPELRKQQGKNAQATLQIAVSRQGASFHLEIRDDGQGIDVDKVVKQARAKGLLSDDADISREEAYRLLFQPGFSTSSSVSSISGRGVGLDVVLSEIEHIGGNVDIESTPGEGTTFLINLPLTSSLNRALLFEIQNTRYVVLMNTLDGVLVEKLASIHQKQQQHGRPLFEYGDATYEYLYLGKLINEEFKPRPDSIDNSIPLLLVSDGSRKFALHIDSIIESRDLVVKTLGQQFASMPGVAGGVIMPDGNVAIVLDLKSLVGMYGKEEKSPMEAPTTLGGKGSSEKQRKLVMVVDDSITVRKVTSNILKRNGMDVVTARNGLEAVELLETTVPDLILLDIEMPKMDGFEFATHVRAQEKPVCSIPIIMITSRIGEKHRNRAEEIGVNEYLCKPFQEDNLLEHIRSY